jgi:hypothetical protein
MADLNATIETPAGSLKPGKRYDLKLKHGDSERVVKNAKVVAFEHVGINFDERLNLTQKTLRELYDQGYGDVETRYEAQSKDITVGFLPEHVIDRKEK